MKYIISVTTETILLVPHAIRVSILITCKAEEKQSLTGIHSSQTWYCTWIIIQTYNQQ